MVDGEGKTYERKFYSENGAKAFASYMVKPWPTFVTGLKITKHKTTDYDYWIVSWNGKF
jgi:hypothetical protein